MLPQTQRLPLRLIVGAFGLCLSTVVVPDSVAQVSDVPVAGTGYVRPSPPGRLVDVDGRRLHVFCKGTGPGPVVVFEAGLSQYTANSSYGRAQDAIAPFAKVCTYDRAGLGWSDPAPDDWTQDGMVADLHQLVSTELSGPVILIGHSVGASGKTLCSNPPRGRGGSCPA